MSEYLKLNSTIRVNEASEDKAIELKATIYNEDGTASPVEDLSSEKIKTKLNEMLALFDKEELHTAVSMAFHFENFLDRVCMVAMEVAHDQAHNPDNTKVMNEDLMCDGVMTYAKALFDAQQGEMQEKPVNKSLH